MRMLKMAIALAILASLGGCAMPLVQVYAGHLSQPFVGPHGPPIGNYDHTHETSAELIGTSARWEHGRAFVEAAVDYDLTDHLQGGAWLCEAKVGWVVAGKK